MIVRILGEGQFMVDDAASAELNTLDAALERAVNEGDEQAFRPALIALHDRVRAPGAPLGGGLPRPAGLILPPSDGAPGGVRRMQGDGGFKPGGGAEAKPRGKGGVGGVSGARLARQVKVASGVSCWPRA